MDTTFDDLSDDLKNLIREINVMFKFMKRQVVQGKIDAASQTYYWIDAFMVGGAPATVDSFIEKIELYVQSQLE
ncbi:hypothetical protein [Paraburkholderia humisilvae]|uniref:Uncharacterized protein n=1 Tax=Paraburkholderia humisilvae TaxID=627669 RepID=A0A6J5FA37_9BURK|nr:hypothetical protein [Paraburkholderia humisilvae]CAB3775243.1 hypothetical protein LMG29542_08625 [Paraburkholderia humisilvae]